MADDIHERVAREIMESVEPSKFGANKRKPAEIVAEILRQEYGEQETQKEHVDFALEVDRLADRLKNKMDGLREGFPSVAHRIENFKARLAKVRAALKKIKERTSWNIHPESVIHDIAHKALKETGDE